MGTHEINYRSGSAAWCAENAGPFLGAIAFILLIAWLRNDSIFGWLGAIMAVPAVAMAIVARALPRQTIRWDADGIAHQRRNQVCSLRWSDVMHTEARADGYGWPEYRLGSGDGKQMQISIKLLGEEGQDLADRLRGLHNRSLLRQRQQVAGLGLVVLPPSGGWLLTLFVLVFGGFGILVAAMGIGELCASGDATLLAIMLPLAAVLFWATWYIQRTVPRAVRLTADGLEYGRGFGRRLSWPAVQRVELHRDAKNDAISEYVAVTGQRARVVLNAGSYGYLPACAAIMAKSVSATVEDRTNAASTDAWDELLFPVFDPDDDQEPMDPEEAERLVALLDGPIARHAWLGVLATGALMTGACLLMAARALAPDQSEVSRRLGLWELANSASQTIAVATRSCPGHGDGPHVHYRYEVAGRTYDGNTRSVAEGGHTWQIGEKLAIAYSPSRPYYSRPTAEPARPVPPRSARYNLAPVSSWLGLIGLVLSGLGALLLAPLSLMNRRLRRLDKLHGQPGASQD